MDLNAAEMFVAVVRAGSLSAARRIVSGRDRQGLRRDPQAHPPDRNQDHEQATPSPRSQALMVGSRWALRRSCLITISGNDRGHRR
jgi:hypothetical protein